MVGGSWTLGVGVDNEAGWPDPAEPGRSRVNGSGRPGSEDWYGYPEGVALRQDPGVDDGRDSRRGRHRGGRTGPPPRVTLWSYQADDQSLDGHGARRDGGPPLDPRFRDDTPPTPWAARPPARRDHYRPAPPPVRYSSAVYRDRPPVPASPANGLPVTRRPAVPAMPPAGAVSRPRERVRGMNAALETGVAGVGEMAPARQPARPRQIVVAALVAAAGLVAGVLTYRSLVFGPVSFGGEVVPQHVYALSFGATGTVTAVKVHAGQHVSAGEVLATQSASLARANLQAAKDAQAAAAAALYADEHPQQSSVTREQDAAASAQAALSNATARASSTQSHDAMMVSDHQQAVTEDQSAYAGQCASSTLSGACQSLAAKLTTAKRELAQAQATAAADQAAGQQQEQSAQSQLSQRQAALQQVQSQASGVTITLDAAKQRLAAAEATVAQDKTALAGASIVAPAPGTVGAVSAAAGDSITDTILHNPVVTVDSGPLIVSAHLPGTEIGEVHPGQAVRFDVSQLQVSLPGKVVQVNQIASQAQNAVAYVVLCRIEAEDTAVMAGMTVSISPQ